MYRLLIADDEENIRLGVSVFIQRHCPRWEICGQARDGREALLLANETLPDAILTDITMPHMNGLEFLESLSDVLPEAKLLVLSGYDQFEYAVQAMRLGVSDYLLKPLDTAKLIAVLDRLADELDERTKHYDEIAQLRLHTEKQAERELERYFSATLRSEQLPALSEVNQKQLQSFDRFCCVLCDGIDPNPQLLQQMLEQRLYGSVHSIHLRIGSPSVPVVVFCIPKQDDSGSFLTLNHTLTSAAVLYKRETGQTVRFYMGCLVSSPERLDISYRQCRRAQNYSFPEHTPSVTTYEDVQISERLPCPMLPRQVMEDIPAAVHCGNQNSFTLNCQALFDWFEAEQIRNADYMRICVLSLCYSILQLEHSDAPGAPSTYYEFTNFPAEILSASTMQELRSCLENLASLYWLRQKNNRVNRRMLADRVDEVVRARLSDPDFSLDDVAAALFISPNYLRQLFKKETGQTFTEYLTAQRMRYAKMLLGTPEIRVSDAAERAGYADARYFSVSFKKHYHMTPSEYRMSVLPELENSGENR